MVFTITGGALTDTAEEAEQELAVRPREGQVARFVENDEVHALEMMGAGPLAPGVRLPRAPIGVIDRVEEAFAQASEDAASPYGDGKMRVASSRAVDENDVALPGDEDAAVKVSEAPVQYYPLSPRFLTGVGSLRGRPARPAASSVDI